MFKKWINVIAIFRSEELLKELSTYSDNILVYPIDLKDLQSEDFANLLHNHSMDRIDVLINNAGLLINKPVLEITYEDYKASFDTNFYGALNITQCVIPYMKESKSAHIVNISSMGGVNDTVKFPGLSVYSSSKGALTILSECLAEELKEDNIKVNCLALGAVQTEMLSKAFPEYKAPISSKQMANYITEFALRGSEIMNGQIIKVALSTP